LTTHEMIFAAVWISIKQIVHILSIYIYKKKNSTYFLLLGYGIINVVYQDAKERRRAGKGEEGGG
jgi:hypothetical protein